jgi:small subunit ribosomal protein S1
MEDIIFNLESIEKTLVNYNTKQIIQAKIITLRHDGAVIGIGGKLDGFIPEEEFPNFSNARIGDVFSVMLLGTKTEDGMLLASKSKAELISSENAKASLIQTGDAFTFFVKRIQNNNLLGNLGDYKIIVPNNEITLKPTTQLGKYLNKNIEVLATEIDKLNKTIKASLVQFQAKKEEEIESNFWPNIFINKIVKGKVTKIMPYGAFVNVDGFDCFIHISDLSYDMIEKVEEVLTEGEERNFKIIKIDTENKKVLLGLKQMFENPKLTRVKSLEVGKSYSGKVSKILPFGALVVIDNKVEGLLHVNDTGETGKRIYELVKPEQELEVVVKSVDLEKERISFSLPTKIEDPIETEKSTEPENENVSNETQTKAKTKTKKSVKAETQDKSEVEKVKTKKSTETKKSKSTKAETKTEVETKSKQTKKTTETEKPKKTTKTKSEVEK